MLETEPRPPPPPLLLHPFNGLFSRTTWVSQHQKGKRFWISLVQEMMGWQWHQLDHMQIIYTSLQTDNHASTSPLSFYSPDALSAAQATASKHWRHQSCVELHQYIATAESLPSTYCRIVKMKSCWDIGRKRQTLKTFNSVDEARPLVGSVLCASFSVLTLLVWWQEGHPAQE